MSLDWSSMDHLENVVQSGRVIGFYSTKSRRGRGNSSNSSMNYTAFNPVREVLGQTENAPICSIPLLRHLGKKRLLSFSYPTFRTLDGD